MDVNRTGLPFSWKFFISFFHDDVALTMSCLFSTCSEYFEVFSYLQKPQYKDFLYFQKSSLKLVQNTEFKPAIFFLSSGSCIIQWLGSKYC